MRKDPTEFRARFKAYKEGKMPYENGLPKYEDGKEPVDQTRLDARLLIEKSVLLSQNTTFGKRKLSPELYYFRYRNSEGFRKRFDAGYGEDGAFYRLGIDQKKIPVVKEDNMNSGSSYIPNLNLVYMGDNTNLYYANLGILNRNFVKAHELSHSIYNDTLFGENNRKMYGKPVGQYLDLNGRNKFNYRRWVDENNQGSRVDFSHDQNGNEGGADVGALGWLLYNEGVFNRMDPNSKITTDQLNLFYNDYRTKHPGAPYLRPVENYGIEKTAWLLNNTASILTKTKNGLMYAKDGKLPGYAGGKANVVDLLDQDQLDTLHYIHKYFSNKGMSTEDIAGIAANIFKESSFRHNAKDGAGYHGYVQMSPDMQLAVANEYGNLNPDTQLQFIFDLITGNGRVKGYTNGLGYKYGQYKTGGDAAEAFRSTFERNKVGRQQSRIDYGNQFYDYFSNLALQKAIGELPAPIIVKPDATAVRNITPLKHTKARWTGAESVSPYLTGKPILKVLKEIKIPTAAGVNKQLLWKPLFKDGKLPGYKNGKIYIKPANRGKFTALKKRTGHSASWFKENGTPAQKKMAVFALNSRKWKH